MHEGRRRLPLLPRRCPHEHRPCYFTSSRAALAATRRHGRQKAAEHWRKAIELDRGCHAAKHNLALASTELQLFDEANRLLIDASVSKPKNLYTESLKRFQQHRANYDRAMAQAGRRPVSQDAVVPAVADPSADGPAMQAGYSDQGHEMR